VQTAPVADRSSETLPAPAVEIVEDLSWAPQSSLVRKLRCFRPPTAGGGFSQLAGPSPLTIGGPPLTQALKRLAALLPLAGFEAFNVASRAFCNQPIRLRTMSCLLKRRYQKAIGRHVKDRIGTAGTFTCIFYAPLYLWVLFVNLALAITALLFVSGIGRRTCTITAAKSQVKARKWQKHTHLFLDNFICFYTAPAILARLGAIPNPLWIFLAALGYKEAVPPLQTKRTFPEKTRSPSGEFGDENPPFGS